MIETTNSEIQRRRKRFGNHPLSTIMAYNSIVLDNIIKCLEIKANKQQDKAPRISANGLIGQSNHSER